MNINKVFNLSKVLNFGSNDYLNINPFEIKTIKPKIQIKNSNPFKKSCYLSLFLPDHF